MQNATAYTVELAGKIWGSGITPAKAIASAQESHLAERGARFDIAAARVRLVRERPLRPSRFQ